MNNELLNPEDVMLEITIRLMRNGSMLSQMVKSDDVATEAANTLAIGCLQRTSNVILYTFTKGRTNE